MLCCVAETGSLPRAAEVLHRVPSNLMTRLRQPEQEPDADLGPGPCADPPSP